MNEARGTKTKPSNRNIRPIHRILGSIILCFVLYFATTGTLMQLVDLRAILSHAPATDAEMVQVREGLNGPRNYVVIQPTDYAATPLPGNLALNSALAAVLRGVQQTPGQAADMKFVELRMIAGQPVGVVSSGNKTLRFDAATGASIPTPPVKPAPAEKSYHLQFKVLHTLRGVGGMAPLLNLFTVIGLFAMVVTGLVLYFQLLRTRNRAGLKGVFWSAGGAWRSLHRAISIVAAIFLLVVSASGTMLSLDAVANRVYQLNHKNAGKYALFPPGAIDDYSSPLPPDKLPAMLQTTLSAVHAAGASPVKAIRLRYFNSVPQGVVIAGSGDDTAQLVYNSETGKSMSVTEPEYPKTHYYLGWHEHEIMKQIHRGDAFGLPGRFMSLFAGLSLIFLAISGAVMYVDLWRRRRRGGRTALFWA